MREDIKVAIVNRNEIEGEGLKRILGERQFQVTEVCRDLPSMTVSRRDTETPLLVIVTAPTDAAGVEICRQIHHELSWAKIVILAHSCASPQVAEAFREGADGYVSKDISCASLVQIIKLVALGEKVIPSQVIFDLAEVKNEPWWVEGEDRIEKAKISDREVEILRGLVDGEPNKVISRRLGIREATVKVHIKSILRKLHVANRTQAAIWALSRGLVAETSPAMPARSGVVGRRPAAIEGMASAQILPIKPGHAPIEALSDCH